MLSIAAKDAYSLDGTGSPQYCTNGALPAISRARQVRQGVLRLMGRIEPFAQSNLDETTSAVGGGTVLLKMVDMARTTAELTACLGMLRDMIKDNWAASEEMERIRQSALTGFFHINDQLTDVIDGFDLLAAIIKPKMAQIVDVECARILLSMTGVDMSESR